MEGIGWKNFTIPCTLFVPSTSTPEHGDEPSSARLQRAVDGEPDWGAGL